MSDNDNTTKIVLHVNNETGKVEKAEQEDTAGNRSEVSGNFNSVVIKNEPTEATQNNYRADPEPEPPEEEDDNKSSTQGVTSAPSV